MTFIALLQKLQLQAKQSGSAASFNCTGAVRKAGFLSVKKWLLRKKHQVRENHNYNTAILLNCNIIKCLKQ